jgi:serine/threonine protein kinase
MVGQTILHYRVIEKIGAGGMGEIYKAEDTRLKRIVAVKALSPRLSADPERRKRFFQEARAASALNHPNIITLYDIISDDDTQCIVMEYVAGRTLRDVIPPGGLRAAHALQYATQMAGALAAAHAAGIIHRDLKPSNVMIATSGLVKILDFGLAKWIDPAFSGQPGEQATVDQALTTEGSIVGTVSYMSPEQALGKRVDPRSDIFSFGCVMYEMITGRRAFEGSSGISTLSSILRDDVRPINETVPDVPPALDQIILRCLPKEADARWQSMKEIEGRLTALHRQLDASGRYPVPMAAGDLSTEPRPVAAAPAPPAPPAASAASPHITPPAKPKASASPPATVSKQPRGKSRSVAMAWGVLGTVLIASAAAGGWWLWKGQHQVAPQSAARLTPPEPASGTTPPAVETPAPEAPPAESAPAVLPTEPAATVPAPAASKSSASKKLAPKSAPSSKAPAASVPKATGGADNAAPPPQPAVEQPPPPKPAAQAPAVQLAPVTVSDALPFGMLLAEDVPTGVEQGAALRFTVADSVRVGGNVVIAKGATVSGMVAREAGKKKFLGLGGAKATFQLQQVDAVDGKKLNVRATSGRPSDGPATRPLDTGKGSKPKGVAAVEGTEYVGYIDGEQTVSVSK